MMGENFDRLKAHKDALLQGSAAARENRIEALRAASRVVAAVVKADYAPGDGPKGVVPETLRVAEQFARWLEKGE